MTDRIPELNRIYVGDCIEVMQTWPENFVDTIITDPPYGIGFMGKAWDSFQPDYVAKLNRQKKHKGELLVDGRSRDRFASASSIAGGYDRSLEGNREFQTWCCSWATEAIRIAKPGAMMLVSGGPRTFHRMTAGLEDAGWQIRDCLMWLYGSGFPKSWNFKEGAFKGWGTALKPAWEPTILAMKPTDGTFAENAENWGVAGINVDGARIPMNGETWAKNTSATAPIGKDCSRNVLANHSLEEIEKHSNPQGRWPANLILDEDAAAMLDGQSGATAAGAFPQKRNDTTNNCMSGRNYAKEIPERIEMASGGASRFFYVAKADRAERNEGCDNRHPTVKPLELMKYLCNLTRTPTGGIVLDPFAGSGTTLWAAEFHNRPWIGIEMNAEYVAIANARIARERAQLKIAI